MKNKIEERNRKMVRILMSIFIVFAIICITCASLKPIIYVDLLKIAETTEGVVTDTRNYYKNGEEIYKVRISYSVEDKSYTLELNKKFDLGYEEEDKITIYYMLSNHEKSGIYDANFRY